MFSVLFKNDQLMWTTLSMALFMVGYCTTTGFAMYYMQYIFGDKGMYAILAAVRSACRSSRRWRCSRRFRRNTAAGSSIPLPRRC